MRLKEGQSLRNFTFDTAYETGLNLKDFLAGRNAALVFLRYYGCTLCRYDLHLFAEGYGRIREAGGELLVVLQSSPETLRAEDVPSWFPFPILCDPGCVLYEAFDVRPARSPEAMGGGNTAEKIAAAKAMGLKHGTYEGDELQLPATFVFRNDLTLTCVRYGENVGDVPSAEELARLLAAIR